MDRKEFIKRAGIATGSLAFLGNACRCFARGSAIDTPVTSCEKKQEFTQIWVKRFFVLLDTTVDEATRKSLMHANGKACHQRSTGGKKIDPVSLDEFVRSLQQYVGKENCRHEGDAIYFQYVQNPAGLKVADGYCLCPMVESGPPGLSGTYCECSVGYVRDMFEMYTGKSMHVELLESLKRGGKGCKFKISPA